MEITKPSLESILKDLKNSYFKEDFDNNISTILKDVGLLIKRIRKFRKISQKELSSITAISQSNISMIECGKYNMSFRQLNRIMSALDTKWKIEVQ